MMFKEDVKDTMWEDTFDVGEANMIIKQEDEGALDHERRWETKIMCKNLDHLASWRRKMKCMQNLSLRYKY